MNKIRWYLAPNHNWIIQVLDEDNNEIDSSIVGNYISRNYEVKQFKKQYNTNDARKYFDDEKCS